MGARKARVGIPNPMDHTVIERPYLPRAHHVALAGTHHERPLVAHDGHVQTYGLRKIWRPTIDMRRDAGTGRQAREQATHGGCRNEGLDDFAHVWHERKSRAVRD